MFSTKLSLINPDVMTSKDFEKLKILNIMKPDPREARMKAAASERQKRIENNIKDDQEVERLNNEKKN